MRLAWVDHSFHKKTKSTKFLAELLVMSGIEVDYFWDEGWSGGARVSWDSIAHYDIILMFQVIVDTKGRYFSKLHDNVVFVPMLDQLGIWRGPLFDQREFWEPFHGSKILNFSKSLHAIATSHGLQSRCWQYYPEPNPPGPLFDKGLSVFFWIRTPDHLDWTDLRPELSRLPIDRVHLHMAHDPGMRPSHVISDDDRAEFRITTSKWFDNKADLISLQNNSNCFVAPRREEGIGQANLEALANGKILIVSNNGTMNEYIISGVNGVYIEDLAHINFDGSSLKRISENAIRSVEVGYNRWVCQAPRVVDYIVEKASSITDGYKHVYRSPGSSLLRKAQRGLRNPSSIIRLLVRTLRT
jgi:hypothetical protein